MTQELEQRLHAYLLKIWFAKWQTENAKLSKSYDEYLSTVKNWRQDLFWGFVWVSVFAVCVISIVAHRFYVPRQNVNSLFVFGMGGMLSFILTCKSMTKNWRNMPPKVIRKLARDYSDIRQLMDNSGLIECLDANKIPFIAIIDDLENEINDEQTEFDPRLKLVFRDCLSLIGSEISALESAPNFDRQKAALKKRVKFVPLMRLAVALKMVDDSGYGTYIPKPVL